MVDPGGQVYGLTYRVGRHVPGISCIFSDVLHNASSLLLADAGQGAHPSSSSLVSSVVSCSPRLWLLQLPGRGWRGGAGRGFSGSRSEGGREHRLLHGRGLSVTLLWRAHAHHFRRPTPAPCPSLPEGGSWASGEPGDAPIKSVLVLGRPGLGKTTLIRWGRTAWPSLSRLSGLSCPEVHSPSHSQTGFLHNVEEQEVHTPSAVAPCLVAQGHDARAGQHGPVGGGGGHQPGDCG